MHKNKMSLRAGKMWFLATKSDFWDAVTAKWSLLLSLSTDKTTLYTATKGTFAQLPAQAAPSLVYQWAN